MTCTAPGLILASLGCSYLAIEWRYAMYRYLADREYLEFLQKHNNLRLRRSFCLTGTSAALAMQLSYSICRAAQSHPTHSSTACPGQHRPVSSKPEAQERPESTTGLVSR